METKIQEVDLSTNVTKVTAPDKAVTNVSNVTVKKISGEGKIGTETLKCAYCHTDPGTDKNGKWSGFRDADTNELVCWACRRRHYKVKALRLGAQGMTYSEMPVVNFTPQLNLNFLKR